MHAWEGEPKGLDRRERRRTIQVYFLEGVYMQVERDFIKDELRIPPKSRVSHWNDRCSQPFEVAACRASGQGTLDSPSSRAFEQAPYSSRRAFEPVRLCPEPQYRVKRDLNE